MGIQSTVPQIIEGWNRESYCVNRIRDIFYAIRENNKNSIVNFDFLMERSFSDTDIYLIKELMPDTVVFYPKTGMRTEREAADIYVALKKIEFLLDSFGYFRVNENSFHFFKRHENLSKYAQGEYSFEADIIGFGHNSLSRIGNKSFLSLYSQNYENWQIKRRSIDTELELLWNTLPYGVPSSLEQKLPDEIFTFLRNNKHFGTKYIPLEKDIWISFFEKIQTYPPKIQDFCWQAFFWSDKRKKDLNLFFRYLDEEYNNIFSNAITASHYKKNIPRLNILIEGIDGSGKDTFARMLIEFLKSLYSRENDLSISLIGLPASKAAYGPQCKKFIEDADMSIPYEKITKYLANNREAFCEDLNHQHPGIHIFVRSILTEQGTLSCLYPNHAFNFTNRGLSHIDLCIVINTDPILARQRIERRGIKVTWREEPKYLDYFNSFFLKHATVFPKTKIVNNTSDSINELRSQALKIAKYIYNNLCEER